MASIANREKATESVYIVQVEGKQNIHTGTKLKKVSSYR
jgi:hypothetical protein